MVLTLKVISTYDKFLDFRRQWDDLLARSGNECVFLTWEWTKTWLDVFGDGKQVHIVLGYSPDNILVAMAPMMVRKVSRFGVSLNRLEFLGSGHEVTPDHLGLVTLDAYKQRFEFEFFRYLERVVLWDVALLRDMREDTGFIERAAGYLDGSYTWALRANGVCPYIELPRSWDEYLATLSPNNRYNIGRKERAISKKSPACFELWKDGGTLSQGMRALQELHRQRMSDKKRDGASLEEDFWCFHQRIAHEFHEKGWLLLGVLRMNGRIVACQYAFHYKDRVFFYQSGIDRSFNKYSPGLLSTAHMIRESINAGAVEYDFLRGSEAYKFHWAKAQRKNTEIIIWNNTFKAMLHRTLFFSKKWIRTIFVSL